MKKESDEYFENAKKLLMNASKLLAIGFCEDAGRNCYLAGMNSARGLLFEDNFKIKDIKLFTGHWQPHFTSEPSMIMN